MKKVPIRSLFLLLADFFFVVTTVQRQVYCNVQFKHITDKPGLSQSTGSDILQDHHGFTTKESGHAFGLHNSANDMSEMGGNLRLKVVEKNQVLLFYYCFSPLQLINKTNITKVLYIPELGYIKNYKYKTIVRLCIKD